MMLIDFNHFTETALPIDRPDFDLSAYLSNAIIPNDYNLREKMEQWREEGIVVFENAIDFADIDLFLGDIGYLCEHPADYDVEIEFKGEMACELASVAKEGSWPKERFEAFARLQDIMNAAGYRTFKSSVQTIGLKEKTNQQFSLSQPTRREPSHRPTRS